MSESKYFDQLETRTAEAREGALMARLPGLVAHAIEHAPGWARRLAGVDPSTICSRKALAELPVLRKSELKDLQAEDPPFGGLVTRPLGELGAVYMSPGPIFDPEGLDEDPWRSARALYAAGIRPGHLIQNCFGYHMTPGAWMVHHAARRLGCSVIPAGIGQTEQQIELIRRLRPDAYVGTPSFLSIIIEKARELGADLGNLKRALVAAEALPPSLRSWFHEQGIETVLQWYGTADVGLIAYESEALEGMILDEDLILEIVRPGTGDLSAVLPGISPCGRTNVRIRGWLGRADQTAKVRGMFVQPGQVNEIVRRFPEVARARLVITGAMANDSMTLRCEVEGEHDGLADRIAGAIRDVTKLRGEVEIVAPGSLPNDGIVIEDARKYD